jgi:hypothetical protein
MTMRRSRTWDPEMTIIAFVVDVRRAMISAK